MHQNGPSELGGPRRGTNVWWHGGKDHAKPPFDPQEPRSKNRRSHLQDGKDTSGRNDAPIRVELVARIRVEIDAGTYDTQEKFHAALDRLMDRLERD